MHTTVTQPAAAPHHAMRSDLERCSQRRCASHLPVTAADCSPRHSSARLQPNQCCIRAHNSYPASCSTPPRYAKWSGALQPAALRQLVVARYGSRLRDTPYNSTPTANQCCSCAHNRYPANCSVPPRKRSDMGRHSQRSCASRRPCIRQQTARSARQLPVCSSICAAATQTASCTASHPAK